MHFPKDGLALGYLVAVLSGDSLEGQLVNSRVPEIAIYLGTYIRTSSA